MIKIFLFGISGKMGNMVVDCAKKTNEKCALLFLRVDISHFAICSL